MDNVALAKRVFYLAWKASRVVGSGVLQDQGDKTEEEVWGCIGGREDYASVSVEIMGKQKLERGIDADYVFGRMVKLGVRVENEVLRIMSGGSDPQPDYQSWCGSYPTYEALLQAARNDLTETETAKVN